MTGAAGTDSPGAVPSVRRSGRVSAKRLRIGAVDIGSNSIRCIIVDAASGEMFRVLDDEKATVRLGEGLAESGLISGAAWQRGIDALVRMGKILDAFSVDHVEAVATSAVREAANGAAFIDAVREASGIPVRIVTGEEEGDLALLSARNSFDLDGGHFSLVDVGGGSVEVVTVFGGHVEEITSLRLGAIFLAEKFPKTDPVRPAEFTELKRFVRQKLEEGLGDHPRPVHAIIGSGGTINSIGSMLAASRKGRGRFNGTGILRSDVVHLLAMLARKDSRQRRTVPGLNADRADIIVPEVVVVDEVMRFLRANVLNVNERGIREGLILSAMRKTGLIPAERRPGNWRKGVTAFARSCGADDKHATHVAKISLALFDSVASRSDLGERERELLEAAALLHDVGYLIGYERHHKHSYHLIRRADIFGFTPAEKEIIGLAARYHRKGLPKKSHTGYQAMPPSGRETVKKLGGILRLADGLDRRRSGHVRNLSFDDDESRLVVRISDPGDLSAEIFGGKAKSDLFEEAFGRKVFIEAVPFRPATSPPSVPPENKKQNLLDSGAPKH